MITITYPINILCQSINGQARKCITMADLLDYTRQVSNKLAKERIKKNGKYAPQRKLAISSIVLHSRQQK